MAKRSNKKSSKNRLVTLLLVLAVCALLYAFGGQSVWEVPEEPVGPVSSSTPAQNIETDTPVSSAAPDTAEETAAPLDGTLSVYVMDVGQGDSILLISPSGKTMLVDASESKAFSHIDAFLQEHGVETLDVVVATHPHSDHIGGMTKVINNYEIGTFYLPNVTHTSATFEKMLAALEDRNITVRQAEATDNSFIEWDGSVEVRILSPVINADYGRDLNDWSVMLHISYGDTSILLTGDAEEYAEWYTLNSFPAEYFDADVLKLGHHGSSTSTSDEFFEAVSPDYAVASMGADNEYGHPHKETIELLEENGVPFYRTDRDGDISIVMDGASVAITTEK